MQAILLLQADLWMLNQVMCIIVIASIPSTIITTKTIEIESVFPVLSAVHPSLRPRENYSLSQSSCLPKTNLHLKDGQGLLQGPHCRHAQGQFFPLPRN